MRRAAARLGIPIAAAMILLGIFMMCQPFSFALYPKGFGMVGIGTVLYIVCSHLRTEG